jgi:hypothetical protein
MRRRSILVPGGAVALAASVVLNAILLAQRSHVPPRPAAPPPEVAPEVLSAEACQDELTRCNEARWALALRAIMAAPGSSAAAAHEGSGGGQGGEAAAAPPEPVAGPDEQAKALTDISRETLRAYLKATKGISIPVLRRDLNDQNKQEALARADSEAMAKSAKLGKSDRIRLEREYVALRASI